MTDGEEAAAWLGASTDCEAIGPAAGGLKGVLNGLVTACREAASQHCAAARACDDRTLQIELESLAQDRLDFADELEHFTTSVDTVSSAPEDEKELLGAASARGRTGMTEGEYAQLLEDCKIREDKVVQAAELALRARPDTPLQRQIRYFREDASWRIGNLIKSYAKADGADRRSTVSCSVHRLPVAPQPVVAREVEDMPPEATPPVF